MQRCGELKSREIALAFLSKMPSMTACVDISVELLAQTQVWGFILTFKLPYYAESRSSVCDVAVLTLQSARMRWSFVAHCSAAEASSAPSRPSHEFAAAASSSVLERGVQHAATRGVTGQGGGGAVTLI
jgi:hypothetical protein